MLLHPPSSYAPSETEHPVPGIQTPVTMLFSTLLVVACTALTGAAPIADADAGPIVGPSYEAHLGMLENMNRTAFEEDAELAKRSGTQSQTGYNNGYYYSFWTDNQAYVLYSNGNGGTYKVDWYGNGDFVCQYTSISSRAPCDIR
jgi:hypothetical protein